MSVAFLWFIPGADGWYPWGEQYSIVSGSCDEAIAASILLRQFGGPAPTSTLRVNCFAVPQIITQATTS